VTQEIRERGFARDDRGRELFTAPWGRTFVVPDAETGAALRRVVRRSPWLVALAVTLVATPLVLRGLPWYAVFLATPLFAAIEVLPLYRATRGLERVRLIQPGVMAGSTPSLRLWAFEALALAGALVAAPALARAGATSLAWATGAFSAAAAIAFGRLLWLQTRRS